MAPINMWQHGMNKIMLSLMCLYMLWEKRGELERRKEERREEEERRGEERGEEELANVFMAAAHLVPSASGEEGRRKYLSMAS